MPELFIHPPIPHSCVKPRSTETRPRSLWRCGECSKWWYATEQRSFNRHYYTWSPVRWYHARYKSLIRKATK